ncbi:hypothetical protein GCM10023189_41050 [Nibrella saemangeumensis]|uniref:Lipoprotein n=1 Tax=Nibrella saemangeumensis TaxID=1084526 RepID=A0ABP8NAM5_9BACT
MKNSMQFLIASRVKALAVYAATIASTISFVACNQENVVEHDVTPKNPLVAKLEAIPVIVIDGEEVPNGRVGGVSGLKDNEVYQVFKITGGCATATTPNAEVVPNAEIAVTSDYTLVSQPILPEAVVKSTKTYSTFTIKPNQFNSYMKLPVEQTKGLIIYIRDVKSRGYKKMATIGSNSPTFVFLPTYRKDVLAVGCSGSSIDPIE